MKKRALLVIGRRIRALRERNNISQEEFAAQAGLDRAYYGGVERGERNLATLNLVKIATALGVEVGELFPSIKELRHIANEGEK
jgi:transcriptional regulator with XRE-family HTH domain